LCGGYAKPAEQLVLCRFFWRSKKVQELDLLKKSILDFLRLLITNHQRFYKHFNIFFHCARASKQHFIIYDPLLPSCLCEQTNNGSLYTCLVPFCLCEQTDNGSLYTCLVPSCLGERQHPLIYLLVPL